MEVGGDAALDVDVRVARAVAGSTVTLDS